MNKDPNANPVAAGTQLQPGYSRSEISMEGASKDQKLAATMTPPVKPSIGSSTERCMVRNKKTMAAPKAVTNQVNVVANSADHSGPISVQNLISDCMMASVHEVTTSLRNRLSGRFPYATTIREVVRKRCVCSKIVLRIGVAVFRNFARFLLSCDFV